MEDTHYKGYELFIDSCYYHMWACRPIGVKTWEGTAHFNTKEKALEWVDSQVPNKDPEVMKQGFEYLTFGEPLPDIVDARGKKIKPGTIIGEKVKTKSSPTHKNLGINP